MSKVHVLRGQAAEFVEYKVLQVDPVRTGIAFKITAFYVAGQMNDANDDVYAKLSTRETGTANWNWNDNREIAWASTNVNSAAGASAPYMLIDDGLVISDLYINGNTNDSPGPGEPPVKYNYYIRLEQVSVSDNETVLALIKERSQDEL